MSLQTSIVNTPFDEITISTSNPVNIRVNGVYLEPTASAGTIMPAPPRKALEDATNRVNQPPDVTGQRVNAKQLKANAFTSLKQTEAAVAPAKSARASAGKKRKSETSLEDDIAEYKKDLDHIDVEDMPIDLNCDQVRNRINKLLDSGIMKKGEFCDAIGSSNKSLNGFLNRRGKMDGSGSDAYGNAWAFFKQRELARLKMPDVKKRQKTEAGVTAGSSHAAVDISNIHLPGEEDDTVWVFDTCDEIRKKISAHLQTPGLTQAQFCRDLYAQLHQPKCSGIQSKQLNDFRGKKGARAGNTSSVFYAAYVYFEKMRLAQSKPKSKHRENMEDIWASRGGFDVEHDGRHGFIMSANSTPVMDQYGRVFGR